VQVEADASRSSLPPDLAVSIIPSLQVPWFPTTERDSASRPLFLDPPARPPGHTQSLGLLTVICYSEFPSDFTGAYFIRCSPPGGNLATASCN
jgi:hypothetical protein